MLILFTIINVPTVLYIDYFLIQTFQDDTYRSALGSSISWEYPPDVNMETVNIEV